MLIQQLLTDNAMRRPDARAEIAKAELRDAAIAARSETLANAS